MKIELDEIQLLKFIRQGILNNKLPATLDLIENAIEDIEKRRKDADLKEQENLNYP